jgi:DNA-binding transcriptional LysR family regulator
MRDLDFTSLRYFVAVCETRNMARAGERENIAPSSISKRMAELESQWGVKLLERRRHGVAPTAAGEALLSHARSLLAYSERLAQDVASFGSGIKGHVRVLATTSVMAESLADDVAAFLRMPKHKNVLIDIEEHISPEVMRGVREGRAAIGICWDAADLGGLCTRPYRTDHLGVMLYPEHALAKRKRLAFADILDEDQVSLPINSAVQVMLARAASTHGQSIRHRVVVESFYAALRVVQARLAISVVPREVAESYAHAFDLRFVPLSDVWAERRFAISYRSEESLTPAARQLVEHLAAHAPPAR